MSKIGRTYPAITPKGIRAPAVLHATAESRAEAQKVYSHWEMVHPRYQGSGRLTYINPEVDVRYFGEGNDIDTISLFLAGVTLSGNQHVKRVAVMCSGKLREGYTETILETLHGDEAKSMNYPGATFTGCRGLEEVFVCIPSQLLQPDAYEVKQEMCFRPARTEGRTRGQVRLRAE